MNASLVLAIREKLNGDEWVLLDAAWKARLNLLEVLEARPAGLSRDARARYDWFVRFVEGLFRDIVWHFRASEGYGRLTSSEREVIEVEVLQVPVSSVNRTDAEQWDGDAADEAQFRKEAAGVAAALTADQRFYLFRAWQLTQRLTEAVNTPLDLLDEGERADHESRVREYSHHHVQMRVVLNTVCETLGLTAAQRACVAALLQVRFLECE